MSAAPQASSAYPGAFVPPSPARVADKAREQARQNAADRRAEQAAANSNAAAAREAAKFAKENMETQTPGDTTLAGDAYLATLPPAMAAQVKALSDGRRAFPTGSALRSPQVQELVAAATQYDPTLDAANAASRLATRKKFTSGTTRDNITAINTALGHLGSLWKDAQALDNTSIPAWNALGNAALSATGDPRVDTFNLTRHAVVDELEKAFRGSGGTQAGIEEWKAAINSSQSPEQLRAAVGKGVELLDSRLQSLGQAYDDGMGKSSDPMDLLNPHSRKVFQALAPGGSGIIDGGPNDKGPPMTGPQSGGAAALGDYAPDLLKVAGANGEKTKRVPNPEDAGKIAALLKNGKSTDEIMQWVTDNGLVPDATTRAAIDYYRTHPKADPRFNVTKEVPLTQREKTAASPGAAFMSGAANALTMGLTDEAAGGIAALGGGDYTQARDAFNAQKTALAEVQAPANIMGNIAGGAMGMVGGGALAARALPGALSAVTAKLGGIAPMAGDALYGAAYGAGENNDNRMLGAVKGAALGAGGGAAGRGATRGLAHVIAPPAGEFAPAYAQGAFPTIGQRFGQSGWAGRAANMTEQALQSFPGLGSLVARAREIPRQQMKVGMFNDALGYIEPHQPGSLLPGAITRAGTEVQSHAAQAFDNAYTTARGQMQFAPDAAYLQEVGPISQRVNSAEFTPGQREQVKQAVNDAVVTRLQTAGGTLNGADYVRAGSELGRIRATWAKNPDTAHMADALGEYTTAMDNAAIRVSPPEAGQMLQDTNAGFARLVRLQKAGARAGGDAGDFTPKAFASVVQKEGGGVRDNAFSQGRALMQPEATALSRMGDTLPNSGSGERLMTGQALTGGTGAMLGAPGALMAHPAALAPFALYAPGINKLVTRAIAPREAVLSPNLAATINALGAQIYDRAGAVGRIAAPGALGWKMSQ